MLSAPNYPISKIALFAFFVLPCIAFAEVSDKEPAAHLFWTVGITTAVICLVSARLKPSLGILLFTPAALWFISLFPELHSTDVRPHVRRELGIAYYVQAYVAFTAALCGLVAGCVWHRHASSSLAKDQKCQ